MPSWSTLESKREAFDLLFSTNRNAVFSFFLGNLGDREDAKDQTQETFSRVWLRIDDLLKIDPARRMFWIFAVARNVLTDHRRRSYTRKAALAKLQGEAGATRPPDAVVEERLAAQALDYAIAKLPEDRRIVLSMSVIGGMTSEEIGGVLGKKPGSIRSTLHDARRRLSRALDL